MADTERTKTELLAFFASGQADGAMDSQDMRDFIVTADIVNTRFSTGLITGGEVTINGDNTKFNIADGSGFYADNTTTPLDPTRLKVSWTGLSAIDPPNLLTQPFTIVGMDLSSGGTATESDIVFQAADFTPEQRRDIIPLAIVLHTNQINIDSIGPEYGLSMDVQHTVTDLAMSIGPINVARGNVYSANGANLNLDKSVGSTFNIGANYENEKKSPNIPLNAAQSIVPGFFYTYRDSGVGFTNAGFTTVIDPEFWDDGTGTLNDVTNNQFTTQRIWLFAQTNFTVLQYGQEEYGDVDEAELVINTENFVFNPQYDTALFRGWLIVQEGTTDLAAAVADAPPRAKFIPAGMFGDILRS